MLRRDSLGLCIIGIHNRLHWYPGVGHDKDLVAVPYVGLIARDDKGDKVEDACVDVSNVHTVCRQTRCTRLTPEQRRCPTSPAPFQQSPWRRNNMPRRTCHRTRSSTCYKKQRPTTPDRETRGRRRRKSRPARGGGPKQRWHRDGCHDDRLLRRCKCPRRHSMRVR